MPVRRILCLANSRKPSGRCLAGREIINGQPREWIRPVSDREHQEVSERERQYQNGSDPQILDLIDVPLLAPRPRTFQQENWLLDPNDYWQMVGRIGWVGLQEFLDPLEPLWINGQRTYHGLNDKVAIAQAEQLRSSLRLIHVGHLLIRVFCPGAAFGDNKKKVQGQFEHCGVSYHLSVTDPIYERRYFAKGDGIYEVGECCLTVSLGEAHKDGYCYKLIAAVIERAHNT